MKKNFYNESTRSWVSYEVSHKCPKWSWEEYGRHSPEHGQAIGGEIYYNHVEKSWWVSNDEYATKVNFCPFCGICLETLIVSESVKACAERFKDNKESGRATGKMATTTGMFTAIETKEPIGI